jgi:catechol 2,3-dioxygenase-like lactoylglutathione lyase family enzyme
MAEQYLTPLHISVSVKDLDTSIAWYKQHLGFELVFKMYLAAHHAHLAFVRSGQFEVEMFQHDDSAPMPPERLNPHEDQKTRGVKHLAFLVMDVDALYERLKAEGVEISVHPRIMENPDLHIREKVFFIHDPDGINFEFIQRL